ncbi:MAG: hypothetical protein AMJ59_02895 [Gammaproteobacteria bacterium SG8_31]|jgi:hypothetical protein|nr:MAG: hypothetical protein AMJ59_02895 [Gammaproteobacteria bacterium SG8_31]
MRRLLILSVLFIPLAATAGPRSEGICGDLQGGTPGLYGLCVAFCEAQELGSAPNSKQSAFSLLAAYESKRAPDDPDMPCLDSGSSNKPQPPAAECRCWTADELMTALPQPDRCAANGEYFTASQDTASGTNIAAVEDPVLGFTSCTLQDLTGQVEGDFQFGLSDAEVEGCKALWMHHAQVTNCPGL